LVSNYQEIEAQRKIIDQRSKHLQEANNRIGEKNVELMEALVELRRTQNQLVESEKIHSVGMLTAGMAHEINNPLNFIRGGVECIKESLSDGELDQAEMETYLKYIDEGVSRATKIITKLSAITTKEDETASQLINLSRMAYEAMDDIKGQLDTSSIKLRLDEDVWLMASKFEIKLLFTQLLKNACDAVNNQADPKIRVVGMKNGTTYQVSILDNGDGISEKNRRSIFNPFFTTKSPGKGEGLGLYFAQTIVGKYGGKIDVKSKEAKGTKVIINLPIEIEDEEKLESTSQKFDNSNYMRAS